MEIIKIDPNCARSVARLMNRLRPEFWSVEGAEEQLTAGIGWMKAVPGGNEPEAWICCRELPEYRTLQIETMGAEEDGTMAVNRKLGPLIEACLQHGVQERYTNLSFIIGSRGLSCHGRRLEAAGEEIRKLAAVDRPEYDWLLEFGFKPSGIYPNIYGDHYHGILLILEI